MSENDKGVDRGEGGDGKRGLSSNVPNMWKKYYVEPSGWATSFTKVSRNLLNMALACLVLSIFYGWSLDFTSLLFLENQSSIEANLKTHHGQYRFVTGGKSSTPRVCVIEISTSQSPLCTSAVRAMAEYGSKFDGQPATAWLHPKYGIVKIVVASSTVLTLDDIKTDVLKTFWKLLALLLLAFLFFTASIIRQIYIVRKRGQ